jgi:hypoxanthine phosphoribosyltransferase
MTPSTLELLSKIGTTLLTILSVLGTVGTFYYGIKSIKLEKQKRSLDFEDLLASAGDIKSRISASKFVPQIIFTPGLRGATFANILEDEFRTNTLPVIVGITFFEKDGLDFFPDPEGYELIESERWQLFIPKLLFAQTEKQLLIVDDFALTGDFLDKLKIKLLGYGFKLENIRTATIATTSVAIASRYAPDFYWHEANDDDFFFPWGKAR